MWIFLWYDSTGHTIGAGLVFILSWMLQAGLKNSYDCLCEACFLGGKVSF